MFKLEIETGKAAFDDYPQGEVARLLKGVAHDLLENYHHGILRDINGNTVGSWELTSE